MAKVETKKEVAVVEPVHMPVVHSHAKSVVDSADIIVPKLLLAQGLSVSVADGKAKMGDITNSLTGAVVGGPSNDVPFIPITLKKYWKRFETVNGKRQYRGNEEFNEANRSRDLVEMRGTAKWEYDLVIDAYGFTEEDVQDPIALPCVVSFTRTSYKAGQKMNTHFASLDGAIPRLAHYTYKMAITCKKIQNDKGIFYVFDVKPMLDGTKIAKTPAEYFPKIERWEQILTDSSSNITVDGGAEEDAVSTSSSSVDESRF